MVCLKSPKSREFKDSGQKSLTMFISSCLTTTRLNFKNSLQWDSNPQTLGFEATEHLRNRMRKENCRTRL